MIEGTRTSYRSRVVYCDYPNAKFVELPETYTIIFPLKLRRIEMPENQENFIVNALGVQPMI